MVPNIPLPPAVDEILAVYHAFKIFQSRRMDVNPHRDVYWYANYFMVGENLEHCLKFMFEGS
jgi:hypothetical protein